MVLFAGDSMSFSLNVKSELFACYDKNRHCNIAELAALINSVCLCGYDGKNAFLKMQTENYFIGVKLCKLIKIIFDFNCRVSVKIGSIHKKSRIYVVSLENSEQSFKVLSAVGVIGNDGINKKINHLVTSGICCKRAYIRGAFLSSGSLCNPEKTYHLEIVTHDYEYAVQLKEIINSFEIESKIIERKRHFVIYIKEGEHIVDLLNIMSAHRALMDLENVRILKGVRNNVNRIVNCETANINKVVSASVRQRESIEYIRKTIGLDNLPSHLEEMARLRIKNPDSSLKELGEMLDPPVGKSGVNHRLKKINTIAENLREDIAW